MTAVARRTFAAVLARLALHPGRGRYAIALSGGADSTALLCLLSEWSEAPARQLIAITVDHALRAESAAEAAYVGGFAQRCHVPHQIHTVEWPRDTTLLRSQLQVQARERRYEVLERVCVDEGVDGLFVGHNLGDQAETLLMRLGRGSGWSGLAGIPMRTTIPVEPPSATPLLRPLLEFEKDDLKATCRRFGQPWVEDPSNDSDDFDRIRIRKELLRVKETNPDIMQRLLLLQQHAEEAHSDLASAADSLHQQYTSTDFSGHVLVQDSFVTDPRVFEELAIRVLSGIVRDVGRKQYAPRVAAVQGLWRHWKGRGMRTNTAMTVGGCLVRNHVTAAL
ncbi:hypothetical protein ACHHYP_15828 [Achlya hypogyna]|uniref:tRNA(Ile)-lysidine synthetase n=1 Tax=Achlya hypogyna TaxID=1202772 RepID=A0A1V9ZEL3_ACHHY|nr:hypothetical protein ACHHYP_15828 [Achlya hypogyna]